MFGVPPGADFVDVLYRFLKDLAVDRPPEYMATIGVLVPSRRMQRRLRTLFEQSGNSLLPRIGLVTDVSHLLSPGSKLVRPNGLGRILELKDVVARLVALDARLSEGDTIDLTISLTKLLDELQGEGVPFARLEAIDPKDQSGHWDQSLGFLRAIRGYVDTLSDPQNDPEAHHRSNVLALSDLWQASPLDSPLIIAGSTGSRSTTRLLMRAVSKLPQGQILLPGFDFDLPDEVWAALLENERFEDHPQYRFAKLLTELGLKHSDVTPLGDAPQSARNKLVSLALRPAPVTDQWMTEGPRLGELSSATSALSLIEARDAKLEAAAIAIAIRAELSHGKRIALIAPDATLARRVTAELKRWNILPDDSGGVPLILTPIGRFLRHTAQIASGARDGVELMALLKHPLTRNGVERGEYMRQTQEFELFVRQKQIAQIDSEALENFAALNTDTSDWVRWLTEALSSRRPSVQGKLSDIMRLHETVITRFAGIDDLDDLFLGDDGRKVAEVWAEFVRQAETDTSLSFPDYIELLENALRSESARIQTGVRPDIVIWGTLEARVQGADVVILGGLNEGVWPEQPNADPWLNRALRRELGLLLPERQIGLAAHDFQQAVGAQSVILSRALRSDGSETVPSRWLSRLTNLLNGLKDTGGPQALRDMTSRGDHFLAIASRLDQPTEKVVASIRPAPAPVVSTRPRDFAITDIQRLIRDPYAIYARRVLRLKPLNPLTPEMDARVKGTVFHRILEDFFDPETPFNDAEDAERRLKDISAAILSKTVPDETTRLAWLTQLQSNAEWLFLGEVERREAGRSLGNEIPGRYAIAESGCSLRGTADRIDQLHDGSLVIFDYKTGTLPTKTEIERFDRQLIIEAMMAENGAFRDVPPNAVSHVTHLSVGRTPSEQVTNLEDENSTSIMPGRLSTFLQSFLDAQHGYQSRRVMDDIRYGGDYDHLARFGEWDDATPVTVEPVGQ